MKAAKAERVIRTLKERLYRFFIFLKSHLYLENLQDSVDSFHRIIKT